MATSAEYLSAQRINAFLFWISRTKTVDIVIHRSEGFPVYQRFVKIRNNDPLTLVSSVVGVAPNFSYFCSTDDVIAGIGFVPEKAMNGGGRPYSFGTGYIMRMVSVRGFVFAGRRDSSPMKFPGDFRCRLSIRRQRKDQLHGFRRFAVRLHASVGPLPVSIGTDFALILTSLHLRIFCAPGFDRHIPAVILVDEILEGHIHPARVSMKRRAVIAVADGDKAGMKQGKDLFEEIAGFDAVPSEAGEVLDNDAVDPVLPDQLDHALDLRPFKIGAGVAVVHKFKDLRMSGFGQSGGVFVKRQLLILDAHALVFRVLDGQPDIERDHIG